MALKIALNISHKNNTSYPVILLRKFFNMVFISPDGKRLDIYSATVFSGAKRSTQPNELQLVSASDARCRIDFAYTTSSKSNIQVENITNQFFEQVTCIEKVWGRCTPCNSQKVLAEALHDLYADLYPDPNAIKLPDINGDSNYLILKEESKGIMHSCIVEKGTFSPPNKIQGQYSLGAGKIPGVEAMNWIKTTIHLKEDVLDAGSKVDFELTLQGDKTFFTPDFTWYFAPPTNYSVDIDSAVVSIGDIREKNKVSSVADDTTVDFNEWVNNEHINERKKARVNLGENIVRDRYSLSGKRINVCLSFLNPEKHGNTQFFLGLVVAFLLSFCSDKTRLNDFYSCLNSLCHCNACICKNICNLLGIVFPLLIIISFTSLSFTPKRCMPKERKLVHHILILCRWIGVVAAAVLVAYVYGLWLIIPSALQSLPIDCIANVAIIAALVFLSVFGNLVYSLYCGAIRKQKIISFL